MKQHWRKVTEGLTSPAPQPENHNRDLDPGFEEDPDIFVELEEGVFYQASYDGTEVAIMADYPGLLPASHVINQETSPPKELPYYASPTALSRAPKGRRSAHHAAPEATRKRTTPAAGKPSKRKANENATEPSSKRYSFLNTPIGSHIEL